MFSSAGEPARPCSRVISRCSSRTATGRSCGAASATTCSRSWVIRSWLIKQIVESQYRHARRSRRPLRSLLDFPTDVYRSWLVSRISHTSVGYAIGGRAAHRGSALGVPVGSRSMSENMIIEIIHTAPAALWVLFALFAYLGLRSAIRPQLGRLSTVSAPGFEVKFAEQLLDAAHKQDAVGADAGTEPDPDAAGPLPAPPTANERRAAVSRLEHATEFLQGGSILWVDDRPQSNASLMTLFRTVGMTVDSARSTSEALDLMQAGAYDLTITDRRRPEEGSSAAYALVEAMAERGLKVPVILFTSRFDPRRGTPPGLFAYTSGGENLVQYVIDVMERIKFGVSVRVPYRPSEDRRAAA